MRGLECRMEGIAIDSILYSVHCHKLTKTATGATYSYCEVNVSFKYLG